MRHRAQSLAIVLLSLATLITTTSAVRGSDVLLSEGSGGSFPGGDAGSELDGDVAGVDAEAVGDLGGTPGVGGDGVATPDGSDVTGGGEGSAPGEAPPSTAGASPGGGATGGKPIRLAYVFTDASGTEALSGTDLGGREQSDAEAADREFRALIDWVNKQGGIAGRKVEGRRFTLSVAEAASEESAVQRCVEITEDYKAEFVIDITAMSYTSAQACFAQHRVPIVTLATGLTEGLLRQMLPYVATTWPTLDRQFSAMTPQLKSVGYFQGAKVGVFLDDQPHVVQAYESILAPALKGAGAEPAAVVRARANDAGQQSNAVLRFRSAGVTHVVFVGNILHFIGFSNAAESQQYRVRYAFPDYFTTASRAPFVVAAEALKDAVNVSACEACMPNDASRSSQDLSSPYDRSKLGPGQRRCFDTMSQVRGVDYYRPAESAPSLGVNFICDHFLLWLDAARKAQAPFELRSWSAGMRALGTGYRSTLIHSTDYADGRQSGASSFAAGVLDQSCACYVRKTPWN